MNSLNFHLGDIVFLYDEKEDYDILKRYNSVYQLPVTLKGKVIKIDTERSLVTLRGKEGYEFIVPFGANYNLVAAVAEDRKGNRK